MKRVWRFIECHTGALLFWGVIICAAILLYAEIHQVHPVSP